MIEPAVQQATLSYQAGTPRLAPRAQSPSLAPRAQSPRPARASSGLGWRDSAVAYLAKQRNLVLALAGIGVGIILVAVFASSLFQRNALPGNQPPAVTGVIAQATGGKVVSAGGVNLTATAAAIETASAQLKTEEAPAISAAATGTAEAGATATQSASNALAAQLALGFISCDKIDFVILESPADVTSATSGEATLAFTWRVRNRAVSPNCRWGSEGQETRLIRASEVGGQLRTNAPVRLEWIGNDEYYLTLSTLLGQGKYDLRWRLLLPKTNLPGGPDLTAKAVVLAPTSTPTPTLTLPTVIPTPGSARKATVCPTRVFECNCREKCSGRECQTVCDECTTQVCP